SARPRRRSGRPQQGTLLLRPRSRRQPCPARCRWTSPCRVAPCCAGRSSRDAGVSDTLPGLEGRIHVQLRLKAGRVADVTVTSTRGVQACRVREGRGLEEVPRLVSLLFSVCRNAQVQAAQTACEQAMGQAPDPAGWVRRELQVLAETLHEHCRMVLVDWPF